MDYSKALIDFDFAAAELKMLAHTFGAVGGSIRAVNETLRKAMYELMHPTPPPGMLTLTGVPPIVREIVKAMRLPVPDHTTTFYPPKKKPNWNHETAVWRADVAGVLMSFRTGGEGHHGGYKMVAALMLIRDNPQAADAIGMLAQTSPRVDDVREFILAHVDDKLLAKAKKRRRRLMNHLR